MDGKTALRMVAHENARIRNLFGNYSATQFVGCEPLHCPREQREPFHAGRARRLCCACGRRRRDAPFDAGAEPRRRAETGEAAAATRAADTACVWNHSRLARRLAPRHPGHPRLASAPSLHFQPGLFPARCAIHRALRRIAATWTQPRLSASVLQDQRGGFLFAGHGAIIATGAGCGNECFRRVVHGFGFPSFACSSASCSTRAATRFVTLRASRHAVQPRCGHVGPVMLFAGRVTAQGARTFGGLVVMAHGLLAAGVAAARRSRSRREAATFRVARCGAWPRFATMRRGRVPVPLHALDSVPGNRGGEEGHPHRSKCRVEETEVASS